MPTTAHTLYLQLTDRMLAIGPLMHGLVYGPAYRNLQAEYADLRGQVELLRRRNPTLHATSY